MVVKTDITRADLLQMQFYLLFRMRANLYLFLFFWVLMVFLLRFLIDEFGVASYMYATVFFAICWFAGAILFSILVQLFFATEKQGFIGPQEIEVRDDGFVEKSKGTTTVTTWAGISRVFSFKKYIFVMISMYRVHIIPRRSFKSDEQFQDFADRVAALAGPA